MRGDARSGPAFVQIFSDGCHATLVTTTITNQDDIFESVYFHAIGNIGKQRVKGFATHRDGSREAHRAGWRIKITFGHKAYDRRTQCVAKVARDRRTQGPQNDVVLAGSEVWSVLFDSAG